MYYLYLDESGDLGFDFSKTKCSKYFTICILVVESIPDNKKLISAVKKTLKNKVNHKKKTKLVDELKGSKTSIETKKYLWKLSENLSFGIYAYTVNKERVNQNIRANEQRFYNWISRLVIEKISLDFSKVDRLELVIDKSKGKQQIIDFNSYIKNHLEAKIDPKTPIDIYHWDSKQNSGLQACDVFCWGIHALHEDGNSQWFDVFKNKVKFQDIYLKKRKERAL